MVNLESLMNTRAFIRNANLYTRLYIIYLLTFQRNFKHEDTTFTCSKTDNMYV